MKLYHGTDFRVLKMTSEEREEFRKYSEKVVDYLYPAISKMDYEKAETAQILRDVEPNFFGNFLNALNLISGNKNGNPLYQLGSFYVTTEDYKAASYANTCYCFGETGKRALRLIQAVKALNLEEELHCEVIAKEMEKIYEFGMADPQPAIYVFENFKASDLLSEEGEEVDEEDLEYLQCYRVTIPVYMDPDKAIDLKTFKASCDLRSWPRWFL